MLPSPFLSSFVIITEICSSVSATPVVYQCNMNLEIKVIKKRTIITITIMIMITRKMMMVNDKNNENNDNSIRTR